MDVFLEEIGFLNFDVVPVVTFNFAATFRHDTVLTLFGSATSRQPAHRLPDKNQANPLLHDLNRSPLEK